MKIGYGIGTALVCSMLAFSGFMDMTHNAQMLAKIKAIGYQEYFLPMDGVANFLAILALLVPGFPMLREWAYAGIIFLTDGAG